MRTRINVTFTAGTRSISTGIAALTIPDIRLIVNETQKVVVASSMQKDNIASIANGVITYANTIPALAAGDVLTVEIDQTGTGATQASVDLIQQRLDIADAYTVAEYPVADCTTMAQNHIKAIYGEVADTTAPDRYKVRAKVLIANSATPDPTTQQYTGTVLNLQRNLAYGLSRKSITLQHGGTTFTTDIPDTGYGFTELWRRENNAWKHYVKNPAVGSTDGNIDTLKPTLETVTTSGGVTTTTYNDIILLSNPATINSNNE